MNQLFMQEQDILTLTDTILDVCACALHAALPFFYSENLC